MSLKQFWRVVQKWSLMGNSVDWKLVKSYISKACPDSQVVLTWKHLNVLLTTVWSRKLNLKPPGNLWALQDKYQITKKQDFQWKWSIRSLWDLSFLNVTELSSASCQQLWTDLNYVFRKFSNILSMFYFQLKFFFETQSIFPEIDFILQFHIFFSEFLYVFILVT